MQIDVLSNKKLMKGVFLFSVLAAIMYSHLENICIILREGLGEDWGKPFYWFKKSNNLNILFFCLFFVVVVLYYQVPWSWKLSTIEKELAFRWSQIVKVHQIKLPSFIWFHKPLPRGPSTESLRGIWLLLLNQSLHITDSFRATITLE